MDYADLESVKTTIITYGGEFNNAYAKVCANHGNARVDIVIVAALDEGEVCKGTKEWDHLSVIACDFALVYYYTCKGWGEKVKPIEERATEMLDRVIDNIKRGRY